MANSTRLGYDPREAVLPELLALRGAAVGVVDSGHDDWDDEEMTYTIGRVHGIGMVIASVMDAVREHDAMDEYAGQVADASSPRCQYDRFALGWVGGFEEAWSLLVLSGALDAI